MVVCGPLSGVVPGGRWAAVAQLAGGVQCAALAGEDGGALADDAQRSAAVASGVSADAALDTGRMLRHHGEDLRSLLREFAGRKPWPTAMVVDSRTLQSTPESGARGGYDGAKRRKGSKVHAAWTR